jgi:hypothetical protein
MICNSFRKQVGRAEQHGAGDLLSDAEGSLHPRKVTQRNGAKASRLFHVTATLVKAFRERRPDLWSKFESQLI